MLDSPYHALLAGAARAERALRSPGPHPALAAELSCLIDAAEIDLRDRAIAGDVVPEPGAAVEKPDDPAKEELARCVLFALHNTRNVPLVVGGTMDTLHAWWRRALDGAGYGPVEKRRAT